MNDDFKVWDLDQLQMSLGGVLLQGFGPDDAMEVQYDGDAYVDEVGADGTVTRSKNPDRRATVTLHLAQGSAVNVQLDAMLDSDMKAPGGAGVGAFQAQDLQGSTLLHAENAWVAAPPNPKFSAKPNVRDWKIRLAKCEGTHGGN